MTKQELMKALEALPDDVIIMTQVVGQDRSAWDMNISVSDVLDHIKWDHPAAVISMSHDNLLSLQPPLWKD